MVLKRILSALTGVGKPAVEAKPSEQEEQQPGDREFLKETPVSTVRGPAVLKFGLMSNTSNARQEFAGDTEGLDEFYEMQSRANSYLLGFNLHRRPLDAWIGLYVPGIVGVFLFKIEPISEDIDEWMWVVVGDLPSAVIKIDNCPHGPAALADYVDAMREWVDAVKKGEPVDVLIPVNAPPTAEYADMLESRLNFLSERILREYAPYHKNDSGVLCRRGAENSEDERMVFKRIFGALTGGGQPTAETKPLHHEGQTQGHSEVTAETGVGTPTGPALFEAFTKNFTPDSTRSDIPDATAQLTVNASGWNEFFAEFSGRSFNNGLYRTHSVGAIQEWNDIVCIAFPEFSNQIMCFGYDWLGRQFALDLRRGKSSEPSVLMFEPGTGYALDIEVNFVEFHESEVEVQKDACLAVRFYNEWLNAGNEPLSHDTCAGYIVPLFLSGKDTIENLELSDMEVYWVVLGQVLQQVKGKS